jgi:hypothetical protein
MTAIINKITYGYKVSQDHNSEGSFYSACINKINGNTVSYLENNLIFSEDKNGVQIIANSSKELNRIISELQKENSLYLVNTEFYNNPIN